jgi:hypothetical protein
MRELRRFCKRNSVEYILESLFGIEIVMFAKGAEGIAVRCAVSWLPVNR